MEKFLIEKCSFHNSHLKGKNVYGHQILVSLLSCDGLVLPYSIDIYDKESMSKIKLTQNLISTLPKPENKGYVLCDSWYSCKDIFNASEKAGLSGFGSRLCTGVDFSLPVTNMSMSNSEQMPSPTQFRNKLKSKNLSSTKRTFIFPHLSFYINFLLVNCRYNV